MVAPSPRSARALQPLCSSWQGRPRGSRDAGGSWAWVSHLHRCPGAGHGSSSGGLQRGWPVLPGVLCWTRDSRDRAKGSVGGKLSQSHWVAIGTLRQVLWWPLRCHKPNPLKLQRRSCLHLLQGFPSTSEQFICPKARIQPKKTGNPLWRSCSFGRMLQLGFLAMKRDHSSLLGLKQRQT